MPNIETLTLISANIDINQYFWSILLTIWMIKAIFVGIFNL